jgi:hypothetical protein
MAKKAYFVPFRHAASNWTFSDNESSEENPISIADSEFRNAYSDLPIKFPDVLVSIGTGLPHKGSSLRPEAKPSTRDFVKSNLGGNTGKSSSSNEMPMAVGPEAVWNDYSSSLPGAQIPLEKFIRLNPAFDKLPEYDDVACLKDLQSLVRARMDPEYIGKLALRLFAALFYLEKLDVVDEASSDKIVVIGKI